MSQDKVDVILRNARIIDPANQVDFIGDIAVKGGKIFRVSETRLELTGSDDVDFSGCIVTPGLVDMHIHGYEYATPLGVNVDQCCLARGSTTVVDAGSAGCSTFPGFKKFIVEKSKTGLFSFLHIAMQGLASAGISGFGGGGECDSLNQVNVQACCDCINANRDVIVGVKIRLSADVANDGQYEQEAYKRALEAAEICNVPLMAHHTFSTIPVDGKKDILRCPGSLRAGDIYTHTYHGWKSTIIDVTTGRVYPDVIEARRRGVLFDLGHGQGSFTWTVAEKCAEVGFWPDFISTDLHSGNTDGPAYDLTVVMSKMLHVGMSLHDVIKATTFNPAKAIRKDDIIGSLSIGRKADISVLRLDNVDLDLEDCVGQIRHLKERLVPVAVWKNGERIEVTKPSVFPNKNVWVNQSKTWGTAEVKDEQRPPHMPTCC